MRSIAAIVVFLLSGCTTLPSLTCGTVRDWSQKEQIQIADDMLILPAESPIHKAMQDYARMRAENRVCQTYQTR